MKDCLTLQNSLIKQQSTVADTADSFSGSSFIHQIAQLLADFPCCCCSFLTSARNAVGCMCSDSRTDCAIVFDKLTNITKATAPMSRSLLQVTSVSGSCPRIPSWRHAAARFFENPARSKVHMASVHSVAGHVVPVHSVVQMQQYVCKICVLRQPERVLAVVRHLAVLRRGRPRASRATARNNAS